MSGRTSTNGFGVKKTMSMKLAIKTLLFLLGWLSMLFAIIGAIVPLIPGTPFLILAAYFFSKSSPKVHSWLTRLPYFGSAIIDWEENRVINPRSKVLAVCLIISVFGSSIILTTIHFGLKIMLVCIGVICMVFILTRKSHA